LIETKQVAMATLAQALIPLACQVPAFLALSSALLLRPIIGAHLTIVTQIWLAASPLFDALITIAVIKQYRIQTFHACRYLFELIRTKNAGFVVVENEKETAVLIENCSMRIIIMNRKLY
jgi:hypothetical protein